MSSGVPVELRGDVSKQVDGGAVRPLHVVEDEHHGKLGAQVAQQFGRSAKDPGATCRRVALGIEHRTCFLWPQHRRQLRTVGTEQAIGPGVAVHQIVQGFGERQVGHICLGATPAEEDCPLPLPHAWSPRRPPPWSCRCPPDP
jgi:hypothetical protein